LQNTHFFHNDFFINFPSSFLVIKNLQSDLIFVFCISFFDEILPMPISKKYQFELWVNVEWLLEIG
jgi:hypothetical protein